MLPDMDNEALEDRASGALHGGLSSLTVNSPAIAEASYALSELGLLADEVDSISPEQLMLGFLVVTACRRSGWPEELKL